MMMLVEHRKQNRHARIERTNQSANETLFHACNMFAIPVAVKSAGFTSQVNIELMLIHTS